MNALSHKLAALTHWMLHTPQHASRLDDEAEAIRAELLCLTARARRLEALAHQPLSVGLYGHASASKQRLLRALVNGADGALWLRSGEQRLDYFTHLHPVWHRSPVAVRLSAQPLPVTPDAPLLLTLYREGEFARRLAEQAAAPVVPDDFCRRLTALRPQAMPQPQPGLDAVEALETLMACQRSASTTPLFSAELLLESVELLPRLRREDRARLLAPFWGEEAALTAAWLRHAALLQQLDGITQVLAPDALLMSPVFCLAGGALADVPPDVAAEPSETRLLPLRNGQPLAAQRVRIVDLARACAEVALQRDRPDACPVDIIDIPPGRLSDYADGQLPDALLVCQAARTPEEAQPAAQQLTAWLRRTEVASAAPRLVWAITAEEVASASQRLISDRVQRALIREEISWGALQLFEGEQAQQASAWLTATVNEALRQQRHRALQHACTQDADALFAPFFSLSAAQRAAREQQIKEAIHHLQQHIGRHGDLLTALDLPPDILRQTCALFEQKRRASFSFSSPVIDLFADAPSAVEPIGENLPDLADGIYKAWVQHLRQLTPAHPRLKSLRIASPALRLMVDRLIAISAHHSLRARLRERLAACAGCREAEIACAAAAISEFVAWLGYAAIPAERRPRSKIDPSAAIFAAPHAARLDRLTALTPQPLGQGMRWAYDWLVAFYNRTQEIGHDADALNPHQRQSLRAALLMAQNTLT